MRMNKGDQLHEDLKKKKKSSETKKILSINEGANLTINNNLEKNLAKHQTTYDKINSSEGHLWVHSCLSNQKNLDQWSISTIRDKDASLVYQSAQIKIEGKFQNSKDQNICMKKQAKIQNYGKVEANNHSAIQKQQNDTASSKESKKRTKKLIPF